MLVECLLNECVLIILRFLTFGKYRQLYLIYKCVLSHVQLFVAPWTVACQAPQPMEFSRQEYWSGVPFPTPGELPKSGIKPASLAFPALAGGFFTTSATSEAHAYKFQIFKSLVFLLEE